MPPLLILTILMLAVSLRAAPAAEVRAALGWAGWIAPGKATPLRVDIGSASALDGTLVVEVPSGLRGSQPVSHVVPLRIPAGGRQQAHLDIILRDPRRPVTIAVRDARSERARRELPTGVDRVVDGVVAAMTREPAGLEFLAAGQGKRRAAYITEADLPVRWQAYDTIDLLVLRDIDGRLVLPAQERALVEWIAQGGRILVVAPHRLNLAETSWLRELLPARGRRAYGLGVVAVAAVDLFAPERRVRGELRTQVSTLLRLAPAVPAADPALSAVLPTTRPLSGRTQLGLIVLSILYIVGARFLLARFGAARGGWIVLAALVGGATATLYTFAAGARSAATSVAQISIAESLGTLGQARVTTYASIIAPYGGRFAVRLPDGATARGLTDVPLTHFAGTREIRGTAPAGQVSIVARQIVPLRLGARMPDSNALVIDRGISSLRDAVLYRERQLYRLSGDLSGTVRLDPARWEPADRPGALGVDTTGRAIDVLFRQLDRSGEATWLIGRITDERMGVVPARGLGDAVILAVVEVR